MSNIDPVAFYNDLLKALKQADLSYFNRIYHPDFKGKDHIIDTDIDYVLKKILYRATRYNNRHYRLLGCHEITPDIFVFFEYFHGFDTAMKQVAELYTSVTFQFKDDLIYREWLLCCPFESDVKKTYEEHDITIARQQRCKLSMLLNNLTNDKNPLIALSNREIDCLYGYLTGSRYKEIAESLHISEKTVETHLRNVKHKYQVTHINALKQLFRLI